MSNVPLPRPGPLGLIQYAGVDMLQYAAAVTAAKDAEIAALLADFTALQRAIVGDTGASAILEAGRLRAEVAGLRAELLKSLADNAPLRERAMVLEDALRAICSEPLLPHNR